MSTRTQLIRIFTVAAAFAVATAVTPATTNAFADNDNDNEDEIDHQPSQRGAPEVDPGTLGSAIALAMGGLAILNGKRRRR